MAPTVPTSVVSPAVMPHAGATLSSGHIGMFGYILLVSTSPARFTCAHCQKEVMCNTLLVMHIVPIQFLKVVAKAIVLKNHEYLRTMVKSMKRQISKSSWPHTQAFPCFSTYARKIRNAWPIW